ncbi:MAG: DUF2071 domain-containing protein [Anaerolineae bacterium]|nr:DUF2071 domain-containing protein [Anaerolineae bacterium]
MPTSKWTTVRTTLTHFVEINYAVPAEQVRPHVPPILELATVGDRLAFVSAVVMREEGFRPLWLPKIGLSFGHINFRTYVRWGERFGTFFFHTAMSSPLAPLVRAAIGMPAWWTPLRFERARDQAGLITRQAAYSADYGIAVEVQALRYLPDHLGYFSSVQSGLAFLTSPPLGYFVRGDEVYEYAVTHEPVSVRAGRVEVAIWEPLEQMGILTSEYEREHPHSVLLGQPIDFTIYFPAKKITTSG